MNNIKGEINKENILFEDNHLIVMNKMSGVLVQGDKTGDITLLDQIKKYLKIKYRKSGKVFLGLVHRIDRPTSGVVIFAKTSKSLIRLNKQFQERKIKKTKKDKKNKKKKTKKEKKKKMNELKPKKKII